MNTAPVSHAGARALRRELERRRTPEQQRRMSELRTHPQFQAGDIDADREYYLIHFASTVRAREQLERIVLRLRSAFTSDSIVAARAIEERLYAQTWDRPDYDLIPYFARLQIPSLIIRGDNDFVPSDISSEIADALSGSRFITLADCGHFAYLEQFDRVRSSVAAALARA
jgi:pimeloyl-ACP methyl ester carboxylesterase